MKTSKTLMLMGLAALAVLVLVGCSCRTEPGTPTPPPVTPVTNNTDFVPPAGPKPIEPDKRDGLDDGTLTQLGEEYQRQLNPVFYAFDKYDLTAESRETLTENAKVMRDPKYAQLYVVVEGHCDERGTNEYNLALGDKRARAARDYLLQQGVSGGRMGTISYGEEKPFETGHDEFAWAQNRRAHFTVKDH